MKQIDLQPIPNQAFSVRLGDSLYNITIKETAGVMCMTIFRDNVSIVENIRITSGQPVIQYLYQEDGNFFFTNATEDLIYYTQFGVTQFLYYASASELLDLRA